IGVVTTCEDITDRKRAEEALRQSEERYAVAAEGANDGLWDWNMDTNQFYFSRRWKAMLGWNENEISTKADEWFKRVHPEDVISLQTAIDSHVNGSTPHLECEYRIQQKDGNYLWVLCRGLAIRNGKGTAYRVAGSQSDINERKRVEAELERQALYDA